MFLVAQVSVDVRGHGEKLDVHRVFEGRRYLTSKWSLGYLALVLPGCSATEVVHGPRVVDRSRSDLRVLPT